MHCIKGVEYEIFQTKDNLIKLNAEVTYLYNIEDYENVIKIIHNNYPICNSLNYYKERFIFILFNSYLKQNKIEDALNLFGTLIFDESIIYLKINFRELYEHAFNETDKFKVIVNINSLILASLFRSEYNLYEILDEFLESKDCDINGIMNLTDIIKVKHIYLLHKICALDTIKYYFGGIVDAEEFRLNILFHLIMIDDLNKKIYNEEVDEINKKISVRNVIKEVNNGRLFVDIDKLKEQLVEKYNDDFNRLLRIVGEKKNNKLVGFNASKPRNWEASMKEQSLDDSITYNEADFIAFKNIYYEVREEFLFSKEYGLDSSLSTRIRHGALENQIRSVFENLNLVTTKLAGEYIDSEYWNSQNLEFEKLQIIQYQIKVFSKSIDDFTSQLKNTIIQISHERLNKNNALFNYYTNDQILYDYYLLNIEYLRTTEDIVDLILKNLSILTSSELLSLTYNYLTKNVYDAFSEYVQKFKNNIPDKLHKNIFLTDNLNKSLTDLQLCLEEIALWFQLETSSASNVLLVEDIINASLELTQKLYTSISIKPKLNINCKDVSGFSSLIYVFNILFSNAILHSGLDEEINIIVNADIVENKYVRIDVINNCNNIDEAKITNNLNPIKESWSDFKNIERSNIEGESGFHKIKRILIHEAKCMTDKFDFEVTSNQITISLFLQFEKTLQNEITNN